MVVPVGFIWHDKTHPCNGMKYRVRHEYWGDPSEGAFSANVTDALVTVDD